jgi:hypothetical protein
MAFVPKIIDGGGQPEPDTRLLDALKEVLARVEAGDAEGLFILLDTVVGEPEVWCAGDDSLRTVCLAELLIPSMKASILDLGGE